MALNTTHRAIKLLSQQKGLKEPLGYSDEEIGKWLFENHQYLKELWKLVDSLEKTYIYMITFTLRREMASEEEHAEEFIRRQAQRSALGLLSFVYVKEYTKKGVAHWHVVVETTKPLKKNRFDYYTKKFGSIDLSRTKGTNTQEALQYISKESEPVILL